MNSAANIPARNTKVMNRFDLTSRLVAKLKNEEAVIGGIGNTNFDLWAAGHRPQNFYMLGSMGLAFPIALGVALAQPKRRVFALEGDGSLLMQLGSLSTIATLAPKNLTMVVMDNGIYQITGAQPTPAARVSDLVAIAIASGLSNSAWAADEEDFERLIDQSLSASGPTLIGVRIDDKPGTGTTRRDPVQIRERFMHRARGAAAALSRYPERSIQIPAGDAREDLARNSKLAKFSVDDLDHLAGARLHDHAAIIDHGVAILGVARHWAQHDGFGQRLADHDALADRYRGLAARHRSKHRGRDFQTGADRRTDGAADHRADRAANLAARPGAFGRAGRGGGLGEGRAGSQQRSSHQRNRKTLVHRSPPVN